MREGARVFEGSHRGRAPAARQLIWRPCSRKRSPATAATGIFPALDARMKLLGGFLSGGQRQMLGLRCALTASADCLLLDEPSAGLAEEVCADVYRVVQELAARGATMIIVEQSVR